MQYHVGLLMSRSRWMPVQFHLPDLPNAGYATTRERELTDAIMQFMRTIERDRVRLLTIVIEGRERWRKVAQSIWRGLRVGEDPTLLDEIFCYFELQAVRPGVQRMLLHARQNPSQWRHIMTCAMPHLEKERELVARLDRWR